MNNADIVIQLHLMVDHLAVLLDTPILAGALPTLKVTSLADESGIQHTLTVGVSEATDNES